MQTNLEPTNKTHRILFTTLIILLTAGVIGGSVYYVMNKNAKKDKEANEKATTELQKQIDELKKTKTEATEKTPSTTPVKDETADWKTYTNESFGFSFKYPETYTLTKKGKLEAGVVDMSSLKLEDNTRAGKPILSILFNPDGIGGCMLDIDDLYYKVALQGEGLVITSKEAQSDSPCEIDGSKTIRFNYGGGQYTEKPFKNLLDFSFYYDKKSKFDDELEKIISTIKITKKELY